MVVSDVTKIPYSTTIQRSTKHLICDNVFSLQDRIRFFASHITIRQRECYPFIEGRDQDEDQSSENKTQSGSVCISAEIIWEKEVL